MQFPSIQRVIYKLRLTLKRFPLVLASAAVAAGSGVYAADLADQQAEQYINIILIAVLGIPLFCSITLAAERNKWNSTRRGVISLLGLILLAGYYFTLPADLDMAPSEHLYRYLLYALGVHLLVAIGPYLGRSPINAFWQYNKTLFLRFLTALFFTGALYIGLAVALGAIEVLLEVDLKSMRYLQLFIILAGIFNTWFFLAGIPPSLDTFNIKTDYPKGLKIFTQNILIPLVIIYLGILYTYSAKIIWQWTWPEGWVANLVLSFSIVGILALLLLHPIRNELENRWIRQFSSSFYAALVPLTILLLLAIYRRIGEYGFTVERYFVMILGLWLTGIVFYFLISKVQNIKVIPASLCLLTFLISWGPWGAFSVSERSQVNRLEYYLQKNEILNDNAIQQASAAVSFADRKEISNIVHYLNGTHGLSDIQPWFSQDLNRLRTSVADADSTRPVPYYNRPQQVVELMGIEYVGSGADQPNRSTFHQFQSDRNKVFEVRDVDLLIQNLHWSIPDSLQKRSTRDGRTFIIRSDSAGIKMYLKGNKQDSISVNLRQLIQQLSGNFPKDRPKLPAEAMTFDFSTGSFGIRIYFSRISWRTQEQQIILKNAQFDLGIKHSKPIE